MKSLKHLIFQFFLCLMIFYPGRLWARTCLDFFSLVSNVKEEVNIPSSTEGLISYLDFLLEKGVIRERELDRLIDSLKEGEFINPIDEARAEFNSELYEHFKGLEEYRDQGGLEVQKLLSWAINRSKTDEIEKEERSQVQKETQGDIYQNFEFSPVPTGAIDITYDGERIVGEIKEPFEAMSTQVTQKMWVDLMGVNPAYHIEGKDLIEVTVKGNLVRMQPDHPIENITWWSVIVFANRLSESQGLKPAYNLKGIKWKKGTSAEAGTLIADSGKVKLSGENGYRLPTRIEQAYLLTGAGNSGGRFSFGDDEGEMGEHAWFFSNSDHSTHPVGEKRPLSVNGSLFYDLHGNVQEWGWDEYRDSFHDQYSSHRRFVSGGDYSLDESLLGVDGFTGENVNFQHLNIGFRLVRTLKRGDEE